MHRLKVVRPKLLLGLLDAALINGAILLAFWLRFDGDIPPDHLSRYLHTFWWVTPLTIAVYSLFRLYSRAWEYASADVLVSFVLAVGVSSAVVAATMLMLQSYVWPRGVIVLWALLCFMLVGGNRFAWRAWRKRFYRGAPPPTGPLKRVLIYGAGHAGASLAARMLSEPGHSYELLGFVDDDPRKVGLLVRGKKVLGTSKLLPNLVRRLAVDEVIIAVPSASGEALRRMLESCAAAGVPCKVLPSVLTLVDGSVGVGLVRDIEMADLLAREPAEFHIGNDADYLRGATVLVTGAGGSIGSELCRQICKFGPKHLLLLGRGENRIHHIYSELSNTFPNITLTPIVLSFTHADRVEAVLQEYRPEVVFHAGAHKHVYLMERHPHEAVWTNVMGTFLLAQAAARYGARKFVLISTDKAVHPISVMGATKRMAEVICQYVGRDTDTQFITVRFGNVIGSEGSVIQAWRQQLAAGRPLTVTHPETTRYFMTVQEAALLVVYASAIGTGGEIFLLDMGKPVQLVDLAKQMLTLFGRDGNLDKWITYTELRPGEKLHETLTCAGGVSCFYLRAAAQGQAAGEFAEGCPGETAMPTQSKHIFKVMCPPWGPYPGSLEADIERLRQAALNGSPDEVKTVLNEVIPEYTPVYGIEQVSQGGG